MGNRIPLALVLLLAACRAREAAPEPPLPAAKMVVLDPSIEHAPVGDADAPRPVHECRSNDECPTEHLCRSPEENYINHCGHPRAVQCPSGFLPTDCGGCLRLCETDLDCPADQGCNGAFCITARRCFAPEMTPV